MTFRCGTIALIGRPNVGKSTLLNRMIDAPVSITSSKPQTTRLEIRGILTRSDVQYVFIDTPGVQSQHGGALNGVLRRATIRSLGAADVAVLVIAAGEFTAEDRAAHAAIAFHTPVVVAVNKSDALDRPDAMLPFLEELARALPTCELVPVSAKSGQNVERLLRVLAALLPDQPAMFDSQDMTDRDERFLAAEFLREQVIRNVGDEVPYGTAVTIESFRVEGALRRIEASIIVEKDGQKGIVIGAKGAKLKAIASAARHRMERIFGGKVFLQVWVKVRRNWTDDARELRRLGLE